MVVAPVLELQADEAQREARVDRIAAKAGAVIERDGPDAEAWLKLPPDTVGTHIDSSLQSLAAEVIYRVKYRAIHISDWVKMLITPT